MHYVHETDQIIQIIRRGESFKCQLHTKHAGAAGWEPHGSSPTTCTGKAYHGFGVCVPLTLICFLKIVN